MNAKMPKTFVSYPMRATFSTLLLCPLLALAGGPPASLGYDGRPTNKSFLQLPADVQDAMQKRLAASPTPAYSQTNNPLHPSREFVSPTGGFIGADIPKAAPYRDDRNPLSPGHNF